MKALIREQGAKVARSVDRVGWIRRLTGRVLARYYRSRGASALIVEDALRQVDDMPIASTRSTMRWAAALAGNGTVPIRYRPDLRVQSAEARAEALGLLDDRLAQRDDPEFKRHRAYLQRHLSPDDEVLTDFVREALDAQLNGFATAGDKAKSLEPAAGYETLCDLHDVLTAAELRPFLVSGTLLGVVRDGGLLAHDYDLDLGLLPGEGDSQQVADLLEAHPAFEMLNVEDHRVWGAHANGVDFDIFLHYAERERYYHATRTHAWWNSPFGLTEASLHDRKFWIPDDVETYLWENYGDWRAPIAFYHKSFDTPNREYCQSAEALLYLYDVIIRATTGVRGDRFAAESAARELATNFGIDMRHHFGSSVLLEDEADISRLLSGNSSPPPAITDSAPGLRG